jgi:hypothetical protein
LDEARRVERGATRVSRIVSLSARDTISDERDASCLRTTPAAILVTQQLLTGERNLATNDTRATNVSRAVRSL